MAHDAAGLLLSRKIHKLLEAKEQQIIRCHHQQVIINLQLIHRKQQVAHSTKASVIRLSSIIHNGNRFLISDHGLLGLNGCFFIRIIREIRVRFNPFLKYRRKLMIRNDDMLIHLRNLVDIIKHSSQDRILTYLQQRLRKVLGQLSKPRCITCRNNYTFHTLILFFFEHG